MKLALAFAACLAAAPFARAETLVSSLSTSRVAITSNYTGSAVVAFGAIERDGQSVPRGTGYDVVVTVLGPREPVVVREKQPVGPIWINRAAQRFPDMPSFVGVFSSRPITEITTEPLRRRFKVGLRAIVESSDRGAAAAPAFKDALLRLREREELFVQSERGVTFLTPTIFRAPIPLPATAPTGNYEVEIVLFADSVVLARTQTNFELVKTGFEQSMAEFARDQAAGYGLATAAVALLFGWLASVVFRRD